MTSSSGPEPGTGGKHRGWWHWTMIVCCIPMLAIAIALVATGVVNAGFVLIAAGCVLMMILMMWGMTGGSEN
ncbi:hypothetical protein LZ318_31080 [Saccharopolyspora indica]|uniref:hypothetical protein n=1 Tax=Saccharopolyspora indica TaxID=1229659 RepID=UPI0022EB9387|nr:hypothetical protein [Saccharopolyspora indica]MDA3644322.1 hypothetical protein [Saccharopolyspora indica]